MESWLVARFSRTAFALTSLPPATIQSPRAPAIRLPPRVTCRRPEIGFVFLPDSAFVRRKFPCSNGLTSGAIGFVLRFFHTAIALLRLHRPLATGGVKREAGSVISLYHLFLPAANWVCFSCQIPPFFVVSGDLATTTSKSKLALFWRFSSSAGFVSSISLATGHWPLFSRRTLATAWQTPRSELMKSERGPSATSGAPIS